MTSRELSNEFWYCLKHHRVERLEDTDSSNRIGPWPTEDQAARALDIIAERERRYRQEDAEWNGDA
jgi:hypothetical protein